MENQLNINNEKIKTLEEVCNKLNNEMTKIENKHCNDIKNISNFYENKFKDKHAAKLTFDTKYEKEFDEISLQNTEYRNTIHEYKNKLDKMKSEK